MMLRTVCFILICSTAVVPARGETSSFLEWSLRGGLDTNPRDQKGSPHSALGAASIAFGYRREEADRALLVDAVATRDTFQSNILRPTEFARLSIEHAAQLAGPYRNRFVATATREVEDGSRRLDLTLRERLERREGAWNLFINAEAGIGSLNEVNPLFGSYLDENQTRVTASLTPGASVTYGQHEAGFSMAFTRVRYGETFDYLGLNKDQTRLRPYLFASGKWGAASYEFSLSHLTSIWDGSDFDRFSKFLYDARLDMPVTAAITLSASAFRSVRDTTFPTAALELIAAYESKVAVKIDEETAFALVTRRRQKRFAGVGLGTRTDSLGLDLERRLTHGFVLVSSLTVESTKSTGSLPAHGASFQLGIRNRIDFR